MNKNKLAFVKKTPLAFLLIEISKMN